MNQEQYQVDVLREFRRMKKPSDAAMAQVSDEDFFKALDENSNSIALIVKHITGNMHSRWQDFLTTDGEAPDRQRDQEFIVGPSDSRNSLFERWEQGWRYLFDTISSLRASDFTATVFIRKEPHSVVQAINRALVHYAGHIGQIIVLAKHWAGERWQTLTIPRGKSEEFHATGNPYLQDD
ncbi:MAG: DUF1572 family protein [Acidobacteria bacterium]|nr:DUF1572 family protein [Acidobacteriota bacterium]